MYLFFLHYLLMILDLYTCL